ncbi:MAG TPA: gephyrin-like molybdotransferase Glp [Solirubrobacteraceae bacterium]|nr:gephyrin-like molybdotransferase Glp [Solirubrobacteraceae bacterium]
MSRQLISIQEARAIVLQASHPLEGEPMEIGQALDRVLAQDVRAAHDVPPFASSAMDGYAVLAGDGAGQLQVVGESRAGTPAGSRVAIGQAIRISTGAAVPEGADAVIRQEDTAELEGGLIRTLASVAAGENVRPAGEVMRAGTQVLVEGTALGPIEIAAAITAGVSQVLVRRQPRTLVLGTGDELCDPGQPLGPGQIHDSNGAMLRGLAHRAGAAVPPATRLPDDRARTVTGLEQALADADVVVISGGVSVGPHDHVKPALAQLGVQERFWGVALQPGKPTWFGSRGRTLVFGLPGNPVSAAVTFALFVVPALSALQGRPGLGNARMAARLGEPVRQNPGREQALRVRLEDRDGEMVVIPNGPQGSHMITSLIGADWLALIPAGQGTLEVGSVVSLHPLPG